MRFLPMRNPAYFFPIIVGSILLFCVVAIAIQGFLPANKRSKFASIGAEFKSIEVDVGDYLTNGGGSFPLTWSEMEVVWNGEIPQSVMDPFASFQEEYRLIADTDRMVVYSVGPDGKDDLVIREGAISRKDEVVLILKHEGESITSEVVGLPEYR